MFFAPMGLTVFGILIVLLIFLLFMILMEQPYIEKEDFIILGRIFCCGIVVCYLIAFGLSYVHTVVSIGNNEKIQLAKDVEPHPSAKQMFVAALEDGLISRAEKDEIVKEIEKSEIDIENKDILKGLE